MAQFDGPQQQAQPLNHHKVPQTYLRGFDAGKGIIVYDGPRTATVEHLVEQVANPRVETSTKKLAAEIDYYTRETPDGPDYSFERVFSRFENWYHEVIKAVRSDKRLTDEQLAKLACLAALQDARVRRNDLVEPMTKVREHARLLFKQHRPELTDEEIEAETDRVARRDLLDEQIPSPQNISLASIRIHHEVSFDIFSRMDKCIVKSEAQNFVTSDNPVAWLDPGQFPEHPWRHFRLSGFMEVTFPLNRRYCLVMAWHPMPKRFLADEALVGTINARTARASREHLFATNTGNLKDRHINGRDFTNMLSWIGAPITALLVDESIKITDNDIARYQQCVEKLGMKWEDALAENTRIAKQFKIVSDYYMNKIAEAAS